MVGLTKAEFLRQRIQVEKVSPEIAELHWSQLLSCEDTQKEVDPTGNTRIFVQMATKRRARSFENLDANPAPFPPLANPEPEDRAASVEPEITVIQENVPRGHSSSLDEQADTDRAMASTITTSPDTDQSRIQRWRRRKRMRLRRSRRSSSRSQSQRRRHRQRMPPPHRPRARPRRRPFTRRLSASTPPFVAVRKQ